MTCLGEEILASEASLGEGNYGPGIIVENKKYFCPTHGHNCLYVFF
jgi:hypothetical protein